MPGPDETLPDSGGRADGRALRQRFVGSYVPAARGFHGTYYADYQEGSKRPEFQRRCDQLCENAVEPDALLRDRGVLVTTIIDYYGLPDDTPGMKTRPVGTSARERVRHMENAILQDLGSPGNFIPFLALHEFEAWLFTDIDTTAAVIPAREKAHELHLAVAGLEPEEINEGSTTAPSKRLLRVFPGFQKAVHGPVAAKRIGLTAIRAKCPHFDEWVTRLEAFACT